MANAKKVDCKYGKDCYQKNPAHHEKYNHPWKQAPDASEDKMQKRSPSPLAESDSKRQKKSPERKTPSPTLETKKETQPTVPPSPKKRKNRSRSPASRSRSRSQSPAKRRSRSLSPSKSKRSKDALKVEEIKTAQKARSASPEHSKDESNASKSPSKQKPEAQEETKTGGTSNQDKLRELAEKGEMDITKEYKEVMKNLSKSNYFEIYQRRVRYSKKAEYQDLLKSPEFIRHKFLVEMPPDFYKFWEFCESITKDGDKPEKCFEQFGLKLVGPFDYLAGKFHDAKIREPGDYLRHWRFFYDPPEFQTIFVMMGTEVHYGYWRDDPKDKEKLLIARNDSKKGFEMEFIGGNSFEAVIYFLEKDAVFTPFNRAAINEMKKKIQHYAQKNNISLNSLESMKKARSSRVVCKTFHKAGLVVPLEKKTQVGYRNLMTSDANLKSILSKIGHAQGAKKTISEAMEELQPIITAANIAVDECDFGTAVELGIDLFCSGNPELHEVISQLLVTGYTMLKRPQFIAIIKAHLENRRKGSDLDMLTN